MYVRFFRSWLRTVRDEKGQDLAEYALLIALIAIVVTGAVLAFGAKIASAFESAATNLFATPVAPA